MLFKKIIVSIIIVVNGFFVVSNKLAFAADQKLVDYNSSGVDEIYLLKGELENIPAHSLTRLSLSDPEIVDVVSANDNEVLVIAKSVGQMALFIWDEHGKRMMVIRVFSQNLELVKDRMNRLFKSANIVEVSLDINEQEGKIVITGQVPEHKKAAYDQILGQFSDDVFTLAKQEEIKDLIQIDMQITQLKTTLAKSLGIDWTAGGDSGISLAYPETLPNVDGSIGDFFKIGDFRRTTALAAAVNALVREGKGRVLSKPRLVVVSGQSASFNVGGQVPITTTTSNASGVTQTNIDFKSYGVGMTITPTIKKEKIDVDLNINISDVDPATAIGSGSNVAFVTTTAQTKLYLEDKQTIVMAGLIKKSESETIKRVPYLSKIPIVGILFRQKTNPSNDDTEIVIALTPTVLVKNRDRTPKPSLDNDSPETTMPRTSLKKKEMVTYQLSKAMNEYIRTVQQKLTDSIEYPVEARDYGWEGTVKLGLLILRDGTLAFANVKEPSGYTLFDDYAVKTAKRLAPFDNFPADSDLQEINVTIPIVYSLKRN